MAEWSAEHRAFASDSFIEAVDSPGPPFEDSASRAWGATGTIYGYGYDNPALRNSTVGTKPAARIVGPSPGLFLIDRQGRLVQRIQLQRPIARSIIERVLDQGS